MRSNRAILSELVFAQDLERDGARRDRVTCLVHRPHAARADHAGDAVGAHHRSAAANPHRRHFRRELAIVVGEASTRRASNRAYLCTVRLAQRGCPARFLQRRLA